MWKAFRNNSDYSKKLVVQGFKVIETHSNLSQFLLEKFFIYYLLLCAGLVHKSQHNSGMFVVSAGRNVGKFKGSDIFCFANRKRTIHLSFENKAERRDRGRLA